MKRPKTHISELAIDPISENPALRVAGSNLKVKSQPIGIHSRLQILFDLERRKHSDVNHSKDSRRRPNPYRKKDSIEGFRSFNSVQTFSFARLAL
jgi:hypothetical protein